MKYIGIVKQGKQKARKFGFPTANLIIQESIKIPKGVYSCLVYFDSQEYRGMCYFDINKIYILEVHIFDFNKDIYCKYLMVQIKKFIRSPQEYISFSNMKKLITKDAKFCLNSFEH